MLHGRQSMRDDERGAVLERDLQRALQSGFRRAVDARGGFVEHEHARVGGERARECEQLPLAL